MELSAADPGLAYLLLLLEGRSGKILVVPRNSGLVSDFSKRRSLNEEMKLPTSSQKHLEEDPCVGIFCISVFRRSWMVVQMLGSASGGKLSLKVGRPPGSKSPGAINHANSRPPPRDLELESSREEGEETGNQHF